MYLINKISQIQIFIENSSVAVIFCQTHAFLLDELE